MDRSPWPRRSFLPIAGFTSSMFLALSLLCFMVSCGRKKSPPSPPAAADAAPEPGPPAPPVAPPAVAAPLVVPDEAPVDLEALTQAVRRYSAERRRVPASLDEVIAAGYIKGVPRAPAGQKFAINPRRVEVVLVKQ